MLPFYRYNCSLREVAPELKLLESSGNSIGFQMFLTLEPVIFCLLVFVFIGFLFIDQFNVPCKNENVQRFPIYSLPLHMNNLPHY